MELIIKNLGPIKGNQQSINLSKKFLIFLGYNNSGKTYVSQLLWTIFNQDKHIQFIKSSFSNGIVEQFSGENYSDAFQFEITQSFLDATLEKFGLFLQKEIFTVYNQDQPNSERDQPSIFLRANVNDLMNIQSTILITIDIPDGGVSTDSTNKQKEDLFYSFSSLRLQITKKTNSLVLNAKFIDLFDEVAQDCIRLQYSEKSEFLSIKPSFLMLAVLQIVLNMSVGFRHGKLSSSVQFFLPASRAFFSIFYTYIYEIERRKGEETFRLISELTSIEEIRKRIFRRSYTQPVSQAIEALYELNYNYYNSSIYNDCLIELAEIMEGDIILDRVEGIGPVQFSFRFKENKQEINLPMYLASSSANQLTLLYLYFKYWAREKGNFLIIDEPEVNLHPENQIKLLDLLINFVNQSDNKVLIATHSPLLADAVNNYLYVDNLRQYYDDEQIKQIIADNELQYLYPDTKLSREDLGVYFFTGDEIVSYDRGHYGIYFKNFKEATNSLQKSARILTDFIYDKENEEE